MTSCHFPLYWTFHTKSQCDQSELKLHPKSHSDQLDRSSAVNYYISLRYLTVAWKTPEKPNQITAPVLNLTVSNQIAVLSLNSTTTNPLSSPNHIVTICFAVSAGNVFITAFLRMQFLFLSHCHQSAPNSALIQLHFISLISLQLIKTSPNLIRLQNHYPTVTNQITHFSAIALCYCNQSKCSSCIQSYWERSLLWSSL